ncbi:hypothetical protein [Microcystis aeruginosa]|uniref:hypothetical protein n=1 Tax=Microcystis aeruginosa TaxID=1126 RepID=UPI000B03B36D|nr:hypothetical protein [Microcystis aeruginosa]BCU12917.1 hypothetical protein MAN88_34810 [Microcystis aeruginosa]
MKNIALATKKVFQRGQKGAEVLVLVLGLCGAGTQIAHAAAFNYSVLRYLVWFDRGS